MAECVAITWRKQAIEGNDDYIPCHGEAEACVLVGHFRAELVALCTAHQKYFACTVKWIVLLPNPYHKGRWFSYLHWPDDRVDAAIELAGDLIASAERKPEVKG
jgi:hypothetical protein